MDGHGSEYPDYFPQSSSPVDSMASVPSFPPNGGHISGLFSQQPSDGAGSSARAGLAGFDLNNGDGYKPFPSYQQEFLQGGGVRGARSSGGAFVPPRTNGGGSVPGICSAARSNGRRTMAGSTVPRGGFTAQRMQTPGMRGSVGFGSSNGPSDVMEEEGDNVFQVPDEPDKANWSDINTFVFASLAVDEMKKGNTSNGTMTRRGYDSIQVLYYRKVGLYHDLKQIKNRYSQLKQMYTFYKWAMNQTGVGRLANGGIDAPASWWEKHTKKKPDCKKFMFGLPQFFPQMVELFHNTAVDGSTACIPGLSSDKDDDDEVETETPTDSGFQSAPSTTSSRKRGSTTTDTASSPLKGKKVSKKDAKVPVNVLMQGLFTQLEIASDNEMKTLKEIHESKKAQAVQQKQAKLQDIAKCIRLVVEAGVEKGSPEFFAASQLFRSGYNRHVFSMLDTPAERLNWVQQATQFASRK